MAGAHVVAVAASGLAARLEHWTPAPIVHGLVAGVVMPFIVSLFSSLTVSDAGGSAAPAPVTIMVAATIGATCSA